jgi:hypothetical protein
MWQVYGFTALEIGRERKRKEQALAIERRLLGQLDDERTLHRARPPASGRSGLARLVGGFRKGVPDDHSLTDYPCRLADGTMGRVAVIERGGEWSLVCRRA